jgi:Fur family zinc uptake transcriptional regulator
MARGAGKQMTVRRPSARHAETILATLRDLGRPSSAYDIQAELAGIGHLAPPTIYRALDRLIEQGAMHKVESLNAFVACTLGCHHGPSVFAICENCGAVCEMKDPGIETAVGAWSGRIGFTVKSTALELHGVCANCIAEASQ